MSLKRGSVAAELAVQTALAKGKLAGHEITKQQREDMLRAAEESPTAFMDAFFVEKDPKPDGEPPPTSTAAGRLLRALGILS
jgi:hypothetical protein